MKNACFGYQDVAVKLVITGWTSKNPKKATIMSNKKIACLVRDALSMEYITAIMATVGSFGVHLVSPFHA